jgi:Holliday junction resolvasome RuvABC endonuclease subunit
MSKTTKADELDRYWKFDLLKSPMSICAIDASTNSLAFAMYNHKKIDRYGKILFEGNNIYDKVIDAGKKSKSLFSHYNLIQAIVIEHTIFMNSPKTAADLALVQGAIISAAGMSGIKIIGRVSPITWQNYLGNKKLSKEEQLQIRSLNPGKSLSWYKSYERDFRKRRTIKLLEVVYDKEIKDYDVADAAGIGHWAINNWEKAISYG